MARPDGSADQSENRRLREHVANDGGASAADRAQHRDDRPALGDRHGHRGVDQERADHQSNRRAHQGHVVHQLDTVAGPSCPQTRVRDDCAAVHSGGDRIANCGKIRVRLRGDQYRVELPLSPGNVLRQRKWGKDVVSAVEIRELLALEHRPRLLPNPSPAGTSRLSHDRHLARPERRPATPDGASSCPATASFKAPPNAAMLVVCAEQQNRPRRRGRGHPYHRCRGRDAGNCGDVGRYRVGKSRVGNARHLERGDAGDPIGQPVDRSGDRPEDAEYRDQIHCGHRHYGDRGDRAPTMHSEFAQAEQA